MSWVKTMTDDREVLSALIDREAVEPDALARVLEHPVNRKLLVDFVRVRAALQGQEEGADAGSPPRPAVPAAGSRTRWLRAAAVLALLAAGGAGGAWLESYASRERPPEPDRVVRLQPLDAE
jgi:hypothetical protein